MMAYSWMKVPQVSAVPSAPIDSADSSRHGPRFRPRHILLPPILSAGENSDLRRCGIANEASVHGPVSGEETGLPDQGEVQYSCQPLWMMQNKREFSLLIQKIGPCGNDWRFRHHSYIWGPSDVEEMSGESSSSFPMSGRRSSIGPIRVSDIPRMHLIFRKDR